MIDKVESESRWYQGDIKVTNTKKYSREICFWYLAHLSWQISKLKIWKKIAGKSACDIWHTCLVDSKRCKVCVCNVNANVADYSPIWSLCFNFSIGWDADEIPSTMVMVGIIEWSSSQSRISQNHQNGQNDWNNDQNDQSGDDQNSWSNGQNY